MRDSDLKFIQIIGTQRSGSNLLRVMLDQLESVYAPHPPHIIKHFAPIVKSYGDLDKIENRLELAKDIISLVEHSPVPWKNLPFDGDDLARNTEHTSLFGLFGTLYKLLTKSHGASYACCKSLINVYYHEELESAGLNPIYIYIYRDGRDVAASFRKAIVGPKHPYFLADKWARDQALCLELLQDLGNERVFPVRYEELIEQPEKILTNLCKWIGLSYSPKMLEYYNSNSSRVASISGEMWQNLSQPIIKNNMGKYTSVFNDKDIAIIESIAGKQLKQLGYTCQSSQNSPLFNEEQINDFKIEDNRLRLEARDRANIHDQESRDKYNRFIKSLVDKANIKSI